MRSAIRPTRWRRLLAAVAIDALIRFIMRQFAEHIEDARNKHIFYIDFLDARTKNERLKEVFPYMERNFPTIHLYEGGFSDFVQECLSLGDAGI
jgi:hypothetical protein